MSLYDFENRRHLFDAVDSRFKFCLLTVAGRDELVSQADFAFFQLDPDDLAREGTRFELTPDEIRILNPNTGTCPVFSSRRVAEITIEVYRRHPVLVNENLPEDEGNPWGLSFTTMFHMSGDSHLFETREHLESDGWLLEGNVFTRGTDQMLPLYQGMMLTFDDYRAASIVRSPTATTRQNQPSYLTDAEKDDPGCAALPAYWVGAAEVDDRLSLDKPMPWLMGMSDITSATNMRSAVPCIFPRAGVGHSTSLAFSRQSPVDLYCILSCLAFDFLVRQKLGGLHMSYYIVEQLAAPIPADFARPCLWISHSTTSEWVAPRIAELIYTSHAMSAFADELGYGGEPFRWHVPRRKQLRAEIDAAMFHIYGLNRADTEYVLGTFPIANEKDPDLTPRILREYDAMQQAIDTGVAYASPLDPPPGHGPRHPPRPTP